MYTIVKFPRGRRSLTFCTRAFTMRCFGLLFTGFFGWIFCLSDFDFYSLPSICLHIILWHILIKARPIIGDSQEYEYMNTIVNIISGMNSI